MLMPRGGAADQEVGCRRWPHQGYGMPLVRLTPAPYQHQFAAVGHYQQIPRIRDFPSRISNKDHRHRPRRGMSGLSRSCSIFHSEHTGFAVSPDYS